MKKCVIVVLSFVVLASAAGCGKKKIPVDLAAINAGVDGVNSQLPLQIGVQLTLTKASVVGDHVQFDYSAPFRSKSELPPRAAALMRGSMVQHACGDASARKILESGYNIDHVATDIDGHELFTTEGDLAVCSNYK